MNQYTQEHARSYYAASARATTPYPTLDGDLTADVCVIGGGFTGVNTAIELAQRGLSVILLEARRIGWGASGRNGGQLIRGIGHDVDGFAKYVGQEGVRYLQRAGIDSVELVRQRIGDNGIECDLSWGFCDLANTKAQFDAFKDERVDLAELGYAHETRLIGPEQIRQQVVNSDIYAGGLVDMGSGHLHPLDLVQGEARLAAALGVQIFEQSQVLEIIHGATVQVRCAHGILPVPAPATAHILRDVPIYGGAIRGELCTPTGAALLKHFVTEFGAMPVMKVEKIGYGMGNKDFEAANCVRALLGETAGGGDEVAELCCNLDDMTAEAIGFAQEELLAAGALDVYTTPIGMKKGRPAVLLSCMCRMEDRERLLGLLFRHTTTLGVRENVCRRYTLERGERTVDTPHGPVRLKTASGWGVVRSKPEYEDVARIARGQGISLAEVCDWLK